VWPWSKTEVPNPDSALRETLFGDLPLATWAADNVAEPWTTFSRAATCLGRGDRDAAVNALQALLARPGLESRHTLEAWNALRQAGVSPPAAEAKRVYGVVVDVPMQGGFDTLAAYEDRSARYLNFSGAAVVWDAPDSRLDDHVRRLLAAGQELARLIGPWEDRRPPLTPGQARISLLTPSGLHFVQAPFEALARDAMAAPVIAAATALMQTLTQVAGGANRTA
jgi:hypothetical protein